MTLVQAALDELTRVFFGAFANKHGAPNVDGLRRLFLPQAVITKRSGSTCEVMTVSQFIEPRQWLLTGGTLVDFEEWETSARTEIFGGIAQRFSTYEKAGMMAGQPFTGRGVKTIQFVLLDGEWRISALAWEDEPECAKGGARFQTSGLRSPAPPSPADSGACIRTQLNFGCIPFSTKPSER